MRFPGPALSPSRFGSIAAASYLSMLARAERMTTLDRQLKPGLPSPFKPPADKLSSMISEAL